MTRTRSLRTGSLRTGSLRTDSSRRGALATWWLVCAAGFVATTAAAQDDDPRVRILESIQAGRLDAVGTALGLLEDKAQSPGRDVLQALGGLDREAISRVRASFARTVSNSTRLGPVLAAIFASRSGDDAGCVEALLPLLNDELYANHAADVIGRTSVRMCRRGDVDGLEGLEALRDRWSTAAWPLGNLGLGLRLVGRYEDAARCYADLLVRTLRAAWALNDAGLLELARGDRERALTLFLEGAADTRDPGAAGTCRGNAALTLLARGRPGDAVRAEALLENLVTHDPKRVRARFWLQRLRWRKS
ncbi:MAG: hypothetical protein KDC95_08010 [Planctomycetes bacterium]|nr:hypothetical protein [Planctomycetota bacterium]